jgi:hypothetical protein
MVVGQFESTQSVYDPLFLRFAAPVHDCQHQAWFRQEGGGESNIIV